MALPLLGQAPASSPPKIDASTLATRRRIRERRSAAVAVLTCAVFYVIAINPAFYIWGDNAHYIIVAKSVAMGQGLRDLHTPGNPPFSFPVPLFPLALSPIVYFSDYDLLPLKLFVVVVGVGTVWVAFRLFRRLVDLPRAVALTVLVAVSPQVVSFTHQVMTEVPYLGLSLVALFLAIRYAADDALARRAAWVTALAVTAACLTRTIGVTLVLAIAAYLVIDGVGSLGRRFAKAAIIVGMCAIAWLAVNASILGAIPYIREFAHGTASATTHTAGPLPAMVSRVATNLASYSVAAPETVFYSLYLYGIYGMPSRVIGPAILALLVVGFVYAAWRHRSPLEYYTILYATVLLLYEPANSGNLRRYLVPLVPFALYYFVRGIEAIGVGLVRLRPSRDRTARWWRHATLALLTLIAFINFARTAQASVLHRRPEMFDFYQYGDFVGYQRMADWARAHTAPSSVFGTRNTYIFHFFSRRLTLWLPWVPPGSPDSLVGAEARRQAMSYVTTDGTAGVADSALFATFARDTIDFERVYEDQQNRVYRVRETREVRR